MPIRIATTARDQGVPAWLAFLSIKEKALFPVVDPSWTCSEEIMHS